MRFIIPALTAALFLNGVQGAFAEPALTAIGDNGKKDEYDFNDLKKIDPQTTIATDTPWSDNKTIKYRGPSFKSVLEKSGIGTHAFVQTSSPDDYIAKLEMKEIKLYGPIIAIEIGCSEVDRSMKLCAEGQEFRPMTDADRGPLYVVWQRNKLPKEVLPGDNSRWIWFLNQIQGAD